MIPNDPIRPLDFFNLGRFFGVELKPGDSRLVSVLVIAALCLTLQRFGPSMTFPLFFPHLPDLPWQIRFYSLMNWGVWCFLTFALAPVFLTKLVFKEKLRNHGLKAGNLARHGWIYLLALAVVLVAVWIVSGQASFGSRYPFLSTPGNPGRDSGVWWTYFGIWELVYFLHFCLLEYFFRGFLLFELEKKFGFHAVFLAMIPYCMIHFQKPFLEALGSIIAGIFLGMVALRTRSILFGMLLHCFVAASMDVAALLRKDPLPPLPWLDP